MSTVQPISAGPDTRIAQLVRALVERQHLTALEATRQSLPLDDPDRHALDLDTDTRFAQMACDHPDACTCDGPTGRPAALLEAIRTQRGEWTTKRVLALYRRLSLAPGDMRHAHLRSVARGDLRDLAAWGWLVRHDEPSRLHYTLNSRKDVRP
jgi:hypothetical protein